MHDIRKLFIFLFGNFSLFYSETFHYFNRKLFTSSSLICCVKVSDILLAPRARHTILAAKNFYA